MGKVLWGLVIAGVVFLVWWAINAYTAVATTAGTSVSVTAGAEGFGLSFAEDE